MTAGQGGKENSRLPREPAGKAGGFRRPRPKASEGLEVVRERAAEFARVAHGDGGAAATDGDVVLVKDVVALHAGGPGLGLVVDAEVPERASVVLVRGLLRHEARGDARVRLGDALERLGGGEGGDALADHVGLRVD